MLRKLVVMFQFKVNLSRGSIYLFLDNVLRFDGGHILPSLIYGWIVEQIRVALGLSFNFVLD